VNESPRSSGGELLIFAKCLNQVVTLAHDLGIEFSKEDPRFDEILVEVVRKEINLGKS
jgi:hypothetical protein